MIQQLCDFLFIHSLSLCLRFWKCCVHSILIIADLTICVGSVFIRKGNIHGYSGKLEFAIAVGFIICLSKRICIEEDMACISQAFNLMVKKKRNRLNKFQLPKKGTSHYS